MRGFFTNLNLYITILRSDPRAQRARPMVYDRPQAIGKILARHPLATRRLIKPAARTGPVGVDRAAQ
jgi:hypothetical protein